MVSLHKIEAVCRFQFNPLLIPWYQITHPSASPLPSNPLPLLTPATQFRQIRTFWSTVTARGFPPALPYPGDGRNWELIDGSV